VGVYGAEGSIWLGIAGEAEQVDATIRLAESLSLEPVCEV